MVAKTGIVEFIDRDSSSFKIKVLGKIESYKTIKFYDFTSARKMMTRIVQNEETGKVLAISKGADSAIISKCVPRRLYNTGCHSARDQGRTEKFDEEEKAVMDKIEVFAAQGYRTLTFAMKELNSPEIDGVQTQ